MTEDGKHTFGIALDRNKAREISRNFHEPGKEKFLTDLLLRLLASSPYVPRLVVLDFNEGNQVVGIEMLNISKRAPKMAASTDDLIFSNMVSY